MATNLTNQGLRQLLLELGFKKESLVKNNHRAFRHPQSQCVIVLPDNRDDDTARQADLLGVKDQLVQQGHLDETVFDHFLVEGKLPAA